jgi:hypothetical protein
LDGAINIQAGHTVNILADVTIDQVTVQSTATLSISPTGVPTNVIINDGLGADLTVIGTFSLTDDAFTSGSNVTVNGQMVVNTGGTIPTFDVTLSSLTFAANSTYQHNQDAGTIPQSTWNATSTCSITGTVNTVPTVVVSQPSSGLNQSFGNFTWDNAAQAITANLALTTAAFSGSFSIINSNGRVVTLNQNANATITVTKDFVVSGTSRLALTNGVTVTLNVNRDFLYTGSGSSILSGTGGTGNIQVKGNFTFSAGTFTKTGATGSGTITFNGTGIQNYTGGGIIAAAQVVNFTVNAGSTLNLGTGIITGGGAFSNNGTIQVGSTAASGAIQNLASVSATALDPTQGNIQTPLASRAYAASSKIVYNGASAQFIGNGQPASVNTDINNASGVTLVLDQNFGGTLNQIAGDIILNGKTITLATYSRTAGNFVVDPSASFAINGTGAFGTLFMSGGPTITGFYINRSSGSLTLGSDLTVTGTFQQVAGNIDMSGRTLTIAGPLINGASFIVNSTSNFIVNNAGALPAAPVSFTGSTALNTLTLNRGATFYTSTNLTINTLNLTVGTVNNTGTITMATGGIINQNDGSIVNGAGGVLTAATNYDVAYNPGTADITTGIEMPISTTQLRHLSKAGARKLTLTKNITINGDLTLLTGSGTFDAGANSIDLKGNFASNSSSTLTASTFTFSGSTSVSGASSVRLLHATITGTLTPTVNLEFDGNLLNNGILNMGAGTTTTFGGTTAISGTGACPFNNIVIAASSTLSGNLSVAGTWTNNNAATSYSSGTVTFNGTSSIGGTAATTFNSIVISGTLTAPPTLTLKGDFTNNGTFTAGTGTVVFSGTALQAIKSTNATVTDFNNINVTNTAAPTSVQVQTNQNLKGVLTLAANSTFKADGSGAIFKLRSTAQHPTVDAAIATLPSGASVMGDVTVERYMGIDGTGGRAYRYISSPVQSVPVSQIQTSIPVTGSFTGSSSCSGCSASASMFLYNETLITGDLNVGYTAFPVAANTETLTNGRGYAIYVRGNIAPVAGAGSALWSVRAPINSGIINFTPFTTYTSSGTNANDGWNLVGNPYPSTISWDAAGWTKTGLNNSIYMRDNSLAVVASYIGGTGTNGGSANIPIGQAFWVKSDVGGINFQATEAVKVAGTQSTYFRQAPLANVLRLALVKGNVKDESVIRFTPEATAEFDPQWDAYKLKNPSPTFNLSSVTALGTKLAINALPELGCSTVQLHVSEAVSGTYSLAFSGFESFGSGVVVTLTDNFLHLSLTATSGGYNFSITADPASTGNRFSLSFSGPDVKTDLAVAAQYACANADASVSISGAQTGIRYYASLNGQKVSDVLTSDGGTLSIPIKNSSLATGENVIKIMAALPGCDAVAFNQNLTVKKEGVYTASAIGGTHCRQGQATLTSSGAPAGGSYHWYDKADAATPITGQSGSQFITPSLTKTLTYFVSAVNSIGCEGQRVPVVATIVNYDDAAITAVDDKTLKSNYATGNRWYRDGQLLADTTASLAIQSSGRYKLEINIGACTTSDERSFVVTGLNEAGFGLKAYPNPVSGVYTLDLPAEKSDIDNLPVFNALGGQIGTMKLTQQGTGKKGQFDFNSHPAGFYYIRVVSGKTITVIKVIKINNNE